MSLRSYIMKEMWRDKFYVENIQMGFVKCSSTLERGCYEQTWIILTYWHTVVNILSGWCHNLLHFVQYAPQNDCYCFELKLPPNDINKIFFSMAQQPPVGYGLLVIDVSRLHSDTPHWIGLLWTSDLPDAETSTWQHIEVTRDRHPCPDGIRTRNPGMRTVAEPRLRPRGHWGRR